MKNVSKRFSNDVIRQRKLVKSRFLVTVYYLKRDRGVLREASRKPKVVRTFKTRQVLRQMRDRNVECGTDAEK